MTVVVRVGDHVRPLVVWAGDRTQTADKLVAGFERFERRQHFLDEERTRFKAEIDVPIGRVVMTGTCRWPLDKEIFFSTPDGLVPMSYADAMDHLDPNPVRIADRAAQRVLDAHADEAGLPRTLTRFVGPHTLVAGVQAVGNSLAYAERCTARQAWWRRATLAEARAWDAGRT
ncbi:hypothetical protein FV229_00145 [Methylobacterium sp. WL120]|nr:hypothetical protein FV229_00145 [Methylobacterium sp. WL120]